MAVNENLASKDARNSEERSGDIGVNALLPAHLAYRESLKASADQIQRDATDPLVQATVKRQFEHAFRVWNETFFKMFFGEWSASVMLDELKDEIVDLYQDDRQSLTDIAKDYCLPEDQVQAWIEEAEARDE
jgi:hypothetical protein